MMDTFTKDPFKPISPFLELGAYETLWLQKSGRKITLNTDIVVTLN